MRASVPCVAQKACRLIQSVEVAGLRVSAQYVTSRTVATAASASSPPNRPGDSVSKATGAAQQQPQTQAKQTVATPLGAVPSWQPGSASPAKAASAATEGSAAASAAAGASIAPAQVRRAPPAGSKATANPSSSTTTDSTTGGGSSSSGSGTGGDKGGKKRGSWLTPVLVLGLPAAAYFANEYSKQQYFEADNKTGEPAGADSLKQTFSSTADSILQGAKDTLSKIGPAVSNIPSQLSSVIPGVKRHSHNDRLQEQKQCDEELGFKMLSHSDDKASSAGGESGLPSEAHAGTEAGSSDNASPAQAAAGGSAAAQDSMTAAADEFPGVSNGISGSITTGIDGDDEPFSIIEQIDMTPINALFAEVSKTDVSSLHVSSSSSSAPAAASTTSSSSNTSNPQATAEEAGRIVEAMMAVQTEQQQEQQQPQERSAPQQHKKDAALQPPATPSLRSSSSAATAAPPQVAAYAAKPVRELQPEDHADSKVDALCKKLGLQHDLTRSGLIAAANTAGLGAYSTSSGTFVPPQLAQLNQATADARLLSSLLEQLAAQQGQLQDQLAETRKEKDWADESARKREESLNEGYRKLLQEQARIHKQMAEQAVRDAEHAVLADTAKAHNEERQQRGKVVDELRDKVNMLSLAFDQRTSQVKSAHEVHKISLGVVALSRALESGEPIGQSLQKLAAGCPKDPLVEAVVNSLPPSTATQGLPTLQQLQQRFDSVAKQAAEAAYFTEEQQGGMLAQLAAKLAVKLKVDVGHLAGAQSPEGKIAQARHLLQQGRLLAAADVLSSAVSGSQAALVVQQWIADARARAAADQAVEVLRSYATTTAAACA